MFVLNNCTHDSRVLKEAKSLADAGYDVRIIAQLDRETTPVEDREGFRIVRVKTRIAGSTPISFNNRSPYSRKDTTHVGTGIKHSFILHLFSLISDYAKKRAIRPLRKLLTIIYRPVEFFIYYSRSWSLIKYEPADIYHCHDLTALPAGYIAKRRTGGKLVYDSHELFTELDYIPRIIRSTLKLLERYLIKRADAIVTVNEFIAAELSERYGVDLPVVVMNCPPAHVKVGKQIHGSLREELELDDDVPVIVYIGAFKKGRGLHNLILSAPLLDKVVIVLLGSGAEEVELKDLVHRKGLENKVFFIPPVLPDYVVAYISQASVGVITTLNTSLNQYFTSPNKLFEYINAGLPVVCSDLPVLKGIVEGYGLGSTCNPKDPADIAQVINSMLANKSRYIEYKKNVNKAAGKFNWETEVKKLIHVYEKIK